jgi:lipopolysaccharide transport system ATP-binding protein
VGAPGEVATLEFRTEDDVARARVAAESAGRRDRGETVYLRTHDERLLLNLCDELWWRKDDETLVKGDPREVYAGYLSDVAAKLRAAGAGQSAPMLPTLRRGDGRATLETIETLGAGDTPTMVWRSGEAVSVRVRVRFAAAVADPVVGMMIRTRIGMEVYGTNTELEKVKLGPVEAGGLRTVRFAFGCWLCPNDYTITAASHDPDGVWHDWLEDAVAIQVIDDRYTAGVANLRAQVTAEN